jgi:NAD(P)-dependent dehydrogenase (short-subunit alcohol dehydrogenase family)
MAGRVEGKVAVITGSTSGIGAGTARRLHEEGAKVVVSGRNRAKGEALAEELGADAAFCRADVVREEEVANLIAFALDRFGRIDVLFNNAGDVTAVGSIEAIDGAAFRYDMELLVGGPLYGMKHAVPHMRRQGSGSIINNASIAAHRTLTNKVYGAAKAAVVHLTRGVAMEVAEHGVRVNSVSPGAIMTPIFLEVEDRGRADAADRVERLRQPFTEFQPLRMAGAPVDIANAVLFLASDESRFVTGHDLVVDGGKIMGPTPAESRAMWDKLNAAMGS